MKNPIIKKAAIAILPFLFAASGSALAVTNMQAVYAARMVVVQLKGMEPSASLSEAQEAIASTRDALKAAAECQNIFCELHSNVAASTSLEATSIALDAVYQEGNGTESAWSAISYYMGILKNQLKKYPAQH